MAAAAAGPRPVDTYYNEFNPTDPGIDTSMVPLQAAVIGAPAAAQAAVPAPANVGPAAPPPVAAIGAPNRLWTILDNVAAFPQKIGGWFSLPPVVEAPVEQIKLPELESNQECLFEFEKANAARLALINNLDLLFKALKTAKLTAALIETPDGTQKLAQKLSSIFKVPSTDLGTAKKLLIARFKQSLQYRKLAIDCSEKLHHSSLPLTKPEPAENEVKQIRTDQDKAHADLVKSCNTADEKQKELILSFKTFLKIEPKDLKLDAPVPEIKMTPMLEFIKKHPTISVGTAIGAAAFFHPEFFSFGGSVMSTITGYHPELLDFLKAHPNCIAYGLPATIIAAAAWLDKPAEALKEAWESTTKTLKNLAHAYFSASPLLGAFIATSYSLAGYPSQALMNNTVPIPSSVIGMQNSTTPFIQSNSSSPITDTAMASTPDNSFSLVMPILYAHAAMFIVSTIYDNRAALKTSYNSILHTSANKILHYTRAFFRKGYLTGLATGAIAGALTDSLRIGAGVYLAQLVFSGALYVSETHEKAKLI